MRKLSVEVLDGEVVIGTADLVPVDASMGVVGAVFCPNGSYSASRYARLASESETPTALTVRAIGGAILRCAAVDLIDFSDDVDDQGREVHVLGLEEYDRYFG